MALNSTSQISSGNIPLARCNPAEKLVQPVPFDSFSPQPLVLLTPQGSNWTPYLTLTLGHPCISVYLLLTVKKYN